MATHAHASALAGIPDRGRRARARSWCRPPCSRGPVPPVVAVVRQRFRTSSSAARLMGLAMGLTAVAIIYSPWGQRSGAHMNPAVTLTFFRLGKVASTGLRSATSPRSLPAPSSGSPSAAVALRRHRLGLRRSTTSTTVPGTSRRRRGVRRRGRASRSC